MVTYSKLHNITHADGLFHGESNYAPGISKWVRDGQPITAYFQYDWDNIAPVLGKAGAIKSSQTWNTAGTIPFNTTGTIITGAGVSVTMDVPRNVTVTTVTFSTAATFKFYGTDYYGEAISEELGIPVSTGNQTISGLKAFKKISAITLSNVVNKGTASVGMGNALGLPFTVGGAYGVMNAWADNTALTVDGTQVKGADATTATAHTGDVRGTILVSTTPDASKKYRITFTAIGRDTRNNLYGVPQFGT